MGKHKFLVVALLLVVMLSMLSSVRQNTGEPLTIAERAAAVKSLYSYLEQSDEEIQIDDIVYKWITNIENAPQRIVDVEKTSKILDVPYKLLPGAKTMSGEPIPEDVRLFVRKDAWREFLNTLVEVVKSRNRTPSIQSPLSSQI